MRQIGIALLAYEEAAGTFPPGTMSKFRFSYGIPTYEGYTTYGYEWPYFLDFMLPELDQGPFFEIPARAAEFDFQNPWNDPNDFPNNIATNVPAFLCPDDNLASQIKTLYSRNEVAVDGHELSGHLLGAERLGQLQDDRLWPAGRRRRPHQPSRPARHAAGRLRLLYRDADASVTDGASNTMAVAEYLTGLDSYDIRG